MAEDKALEDTIYHLGRGLNSDTAQVDLDRFLKVRSRLPLAVSVSRLMMWRQWRGLTEGEKPGAGAVYQARARQQNFAQHGHPADPAGRHCWAAGLWKFGCNLSVFSSRHLCPPMHPFARRFDTVAPQSLLHARRGSACKTAAERALPLAVATDSLSRLSHCYAEP